MMKSHAILPDNLNHPFICCALLPYLVAFLVIRSFVTVLVFTQSIFYLVTPTRNTVDAGNLDVPKRNHKGLMLSEKMKVLKKNYMLRLLNSWPQYMMNA